MTEQSKTFSKKHFRSAVVVVGILLLALGILHFVHWNTKARISNAPEFRTLTILRQVLPDFDNNPVKDKYTLEDEDFEGTVFFPAKRNGQLTGIAVRTYSDNGYNDRVWLMIGVVPGDNGYVIYNIYILNHRETAGFGNHMDNPVFKNQFKGHNPDTFKMRIKKDRGNVDGISGATITTRAFCDAVDNAFQALEELEESGPAENTGDKEDKKGTGKAKGK